MQFTRLVAPTLAMGAAAVVGGVPWATRGLVEAVVMLAIVAALVGMYRLRRYARATLLYHRR